MTDDDMRKMLAKVADRIQERMGPLFGSPEYLADPVKLDRAQRRQRESAESWATIAVEETMAAVRATTIEEGAKVAESEPGIVSEHRSGGSFAAARADQCKLVATAIRALNQPLDGGA